MFAKTGPLKHLFPAIWQTAIARNQQAYDLKVLELRFRTVVLYFRTPSVVHSHKFLILNSGGLLVCCHPLNPPVLLDCCNQAN